MEHDARSAQEYEAHVNRLIATLATARRAGMSPERIEHDLTLNLAAETASTATDE